MDRSHRPMIGVRLDAKLAARFDSLANALDLNQTALLAAAIEIWVDRWESSGRNVERWLAAGPNVSWDRWLAGAQQIVEERKSRDELRVERKLLPVRIDQRAGHWLKQAAGLLGPRMQTAVLVSLVEYWCEYWEATGVAPAQEWLVKQPKPDWWPLWMAWCDLAKHHPPPRSAKRRTVVIRLDPETAVAFDQIVAAVGRSRNVAVQSLLVMAADGWDKLGIAPTLSWTSKKPPPPWWPGWQMMMTRARAIGAVRRGEPIQDD